MNDINIFAIWASLLIWINMFTFIVSFHSKKLRISSMLFVNFMMIIILVKPYVYA